MEVSTQTYRFLERLNAMDEGSQVAFRRIYTLSPHGAGFAAIGEHVRVAMVEALSHAPIAQWVRLNLALRVSLKLSQTTRQVLRAQRLEASLEDFHIASEAYIFRISLSEAVLQRRERQARQKASVGIKRPRSIMTSQPIPTLDEAELSSELSTQLQAIREFKAKLIPGFVQAIRRARVVS
jgi:hypothetical protein